MPPKTSNLFYETLASLSDEEYPEHLFYARYRGVEFLKYKYRKKYKNAEHIGQTLAGIYRVHMVKRLESSFFAFKKSLDTLLRITNDMIRMFNENKVIIAPELNVKDLLLKGWELDQIIEHALEKGYIKENFVYNAGAFKPEFIEMLHNDKAVLEKLNVEWNTEISDPKFNLFREKMEGEFFNTNKNASGKLVIFSESVDTLTYLYNRIKKELKREDILIVTSKNRNNLEKTIKENFDANYATDSHLYNIILTSDVLSEGVNLHRSNIIVNYDSPWNATRFMQRIGRVNRIGSIANNIYNYMFYPSQQGDREIQLYRNALIKLQGFHSAFGEDAQIYSREEIVKQFQLFDSNVKDSVDKKIALLREVRELYNTDRKLYHKIKALPLKSRVMRNTNKHKGKTIVFISSNVKTEFYLANKDKVTTIDFLDAVTYLKAKPEEQPAPFTHEEQHYKHVNNALIKYNSEYIEAAAIDSSAKRTDIDKTALEANHFLRTIKQIITDTETTTQCDVLIGYINEGIYARLPRQLKTLAREYKNDRERLRKEEYVIQNRIEELYKEYLTQNREQRKSQQDITDPQIIISETFV